MARAAAVCCAVLAIAGAASAFHLLPIEKMGNAVLKAPSAAAAAVAPASLGGSPHEKLIGTYVAECVDSSWFDPTSKDLFNVSTLTTTQYNSDGSYTVSLVEYSAGDQIGRCNPSLTDDFAAYEMRGTFEPKGVNALNKSLNNGEWTVESSTWNFPAHASSRTATLLQILNQECPCGGEWHAGTERSVDPASDCSEKERTQKNAFYLCALIAGQPAYSVYEQNKEGYISGYLSFDPVEGYSGKAVSGQRHKVIEGGNTQPDKCDYALFSDCGDAVQQSAKSCRGCEGLECEGCVYTEVTERTKLPTDLAYEDCCPCFYYYASRYTAPYLEVSC